MEYLENLMPQSDIGIVLVIIFGPIIATVVPFVVIMRLIKMYDEYVSEGTKDTLAVLFPILTCFLGFFGPLWAGFMGFFGSVEIFYFSILVGLLIGFYSIFYLNHIQGN